MRPWQLPVQDVLAEFGSSENGLTTNEAEQRLKKYGPNKLPRAQRHWLQILFSQFTSPLILILFAASAISALLGNVLDTAVIIGVIIIDGLLGFAQEWKSEKAIEKLEAFISHKTKVIRNGERIEIDASELVPGDVVAIEIGDKIPADMRLIHANELEIDEAILTGESWPVHKSVKPVNTTSPLKATNMCFMGTIVTNGNGIGMVTSTGIETQFGQIAATLKETESEGEFQKGIRKFSKNLIKWVLIGCALIFLINALLAKNMLLSFIFAVALAVGIVPEALPIIITIALSSSALHLSKQKVIVKKLAAIEDMGNIDVLCTDKTGTLTENRITLKGFFDASGRKDEKIIIFGLLCNSAFRHNETIRGNVIDAAIWQWASKSKFDLKKISVWQKILDIPFDYTRRRMSVAVRKGSEQLLICKGAPESVMHVCSKVRINGTEKQIGKYIKKIEYKWKEWGSQGYRVIAVATKPITGKKKLSKKDEQNMTFEGFLVFTDPPKATAAEAIKRATQLGVQIKILTGDGPTVTKAVAKSVGLDVSDEQILLGEQIEQLNDSQLKDVVKNVIIFARVTPEQKRRIITALQKCGYTTAYLGDGVNDASALKAADVGISVDTGADIAKDSADIVLLRKDLHVLVDGIIGGRKTFNNIVKYILITMSANIGNMITLAIISPILPFVPLLPSQILLTNFLTDTPMISISTDNVDTEELKRPRHWDIKQISNFGMMLSAVSSIFDFVTIALLIWALANVELFRTAWFLESVLSEIIIVFSIRAHHFFLKDVQPSKLLLAISAGVIALTLAIIYSPLGPAFEFVWLPGWLLLAIVVILAFYFILTEAVKLTYWRTKEKI
jgi:Mg2+-importing ATPase